MPPETRYARSGDVHIAYQVFGDGPVDVVSGTVRDLVAGSGLEFDDRGAAELKGLPGEVRLFALRG